MTHATHAHSVFDELTLEPGQHRAVGLGFYEEGIPEPLFCIQCDPNGSCQHIEATLIRKEGFGEYSLTYDIENADQTTAHVTVLSCEMAQV